MDQTVTKENKMGTMPINALLLNMAIPIMISMMVQALYNIVDSLFVSRISENALTAVSLAFPIQNLMIAIATGTGVGINALLSRSLGENNQKEANEAAKNGIFLSFLSSIAFLFLGLLGSNYFFHTQTDIAEIINDGTVYLEICTVFSFGLFGAITFVTGNGKNPLFYVHADSRCCHQHHFRPYSYLWSFWSSKTRNRWCCTRNNNRANYWLYLICYYQCKEK